MRALSYFLVVCCFACTRPEQPGKTSGSDAPLTAAPAVSGAAPSSAAPAEKPQSAESCRATCNGEWGAHGITGAVSCVCRTTDFGKDCRDKTDCKGDCLLDPVRSEVVSPGPPVTGYFVGKCSEFVTTFGCARRIQAGTKERGPVELSEPPPMICLD
jgi:hypothetical protein